MTNDRYAVGREEAAPEMATGDGASRKRNRAWTLRENFWERFKAFTVAEFQATSSQRARTYAVACGTHVA